MKGSEITEKETSWEEVEQEAGLLAAADEAASGDRSGSAEPEEDGGQDGEFYTVYFDKEYEFDNGDGSRKYKSLDLSGLLDLTTVDGEIFDRAMEKERHVPANKFKDTTYTKFVAMKVTKLPVEFFNMLCIRDMWKVTAVVYLFFLRG